MTIFEAVAIDRSVVALVRMVDGEAIATVVYQTGEAHDFDRSQLVDECRTWLFAGKSNATSTLFAALCAMPLHGEEL